MTECMQIDPQVLTALRVTLALGFFFIVGLFMIDFASNAKPYVGPVSPRVRQLPEEECKLHARKLKDCPPGSHDQEPDDDGS